MQVGEFGLEPHDRMMGAGDVAGAAGAGAVGARRFDRGFDHVRMEAHAEIIVRAPHGDLARPILFALGTPQRRRKPAGVAFEVGESPVALFRLQAGDRIRKAPLVVHQSAFLMGSRFVPPSDPAHFGIRPARPCLVRFGRSAATQ